MLIGAGLLIAADNFDYGTLDDVMKYTGAIGIGWNLGSLTRSIKYNLREYNESD